MPNLRPIEYPIVSPMMAPIVAAAPTATGLMSSVCREASSAALTSAISPGSGIPRLSMPMTAPTTRYTASGGIVCSTASTFTPLRLPFDWRISGRVSEEFQHRGVDDLRRFDEPEVARIRNLQVVPVGDGVGDLAAEVRG